MSPHQNSLSNTPKPNTRHVIRFETDSQDMQQTTTKTKDLRLKIEKKKRKRVLINRRLAKLSDEIEALKNKRSKQLKANLPDLRETINKNREPAAGEPNLNIHRHVVKPKPIQPSENPLPATSVNTNGFSRPKFQLRRNFKVDRLGIPTLLLGNNDQQAISPESNQLPMYKEFDADDFMLSHLMASSSFSDGSLIN